MLISGRQARAVIEGVRVSPRGARRLLSSGLAGVPIVTRGAHLYDEEQVRAVARRPTILWPEFDQVCPAGVFIARRDVDVTAPRDEQLDVLAGGWGPLSMVAGFVVLGADIVGLREGSDLVLREPGGWFAQVEDRRLPSGPGRPWVLFPGPLRVATPTWTSTDT